MHFMHEAKEIPLYSEGKCGSSSLLFRIGWIMHFFHDKGIIPFKHQLTKLSMKLIAFSFTKHSIGIPFSPQALPLPAYLTAFCTSSEGQEQWKKRGTWCFCN